MVQANLQLKIHLGHDGGQNSQCVFYFRFEQQVEKRRVKRDGSAFPDFDLSAIHTVSKRQNGFPEDPMFNEQWHLNRGARGGFDMNVQPAWARGFTGKGVVVSILDDGIQTNHPDLR